MRVGRFTAVLVALTSVVMVATSVPASANTRAGAGSYMNRQQNLNSTPGAPGYFTARAGLEVWMDCFESGPTAYGQNKWFRVTVRANDGYGQVGSVPAPSVSNQWNASPHC